MWREVTFADVVGYGADLSVDHLLVQLFDVERLHHEGQSPCEHGKHAHTPDHTHTHGYEGTRLKAHV